MPKFSLRFERYLQSQCIVEVEADTLDAAVAAAEALDPYALDWDEPDPTCATATRLYSVEREGEVDARVGFAEDYGQCWTNACLVEQWSRALSEPLKREELASFADQAAAHYGRLTPELSDEARRDLESARLRASTVMPIGEADPRRARL